MWPPGTVCRPGPAHQSSKYPARRREAAPAARGKLHPSPPPLSLSGSLATASQGKLTLTNGCGPPTAHVASESFTGPWTEGPRNSVQGLRPRL